jgi:YidC/Oxa1 family membrane protein insertase
MQSMVRVAPQLKELQNKHKGDKQRQQQEVMKFYAENKINPFASCLPLVAQMPFFIGLFYLLQTDLRREICGGAIQAAELVNGKLPPCGQVAGADGSESFLFIPDLTDKATGWVLAVLIVLYICSQLLSSVLTPSTADRNQRMIMYGLPFVFVFFVINFPAGLIVYWITTNLWTVGQGYVLRRRLGPVSPPKDAVALPSSVGTSTVGTGGGFMGRLAAITGAAGAKGSDEGKAETAGGGDAAAAPKKPTASKAKSRAPAPATAAAGTGAKAEGRASRRATKAGATAEPAAKPARNGPPPPPPRKKKKRSGRRR